MHSQYARPCANLGASPSTEYVPLGHSSSSWSGAGAYSHALAPVDELGQQIPQFHRIEPNDIAQSREHSLGDLMIPSEKPPVPVGGYGSGDWTRIPQTQFHGAKAIDTTRSSEYSSGVPVNASQDTLLVGGYGGGDCARIPHAHFYGAKAIDPTQFREHCPGVPANASQRAGPVGGHCAITQEQFYNVEISGRAQADECCDHRGNIPFPGIGDDFSTATNSQDDQSKPGAQLHEQIGSYDWHADGDVRFHEQNIAASCVAPKSDDVPRTPLSTMVPAEIPYAWSPLPCSAADNCGYRNPASPFSDSNFSPFGVPVPPEVRDALQRPSMAQWVSKVMDQHLPKKP